MKKIAFILAIFSCAFTSAFGQTARLSFALYSPKVRISIVDPLVNFDPAKPSTVLLPDAGGIYAYKAQVGKPRYVVAYLSTPDTSMIISPFLTSGDDLRFTVSLINKKVVFAASGKGNANNQPEGFPFTGMDLLRFRGDTSPKRVWQGIRQQEVVNRMLLPRYIKKYHPSAAWIQNANLNAQYFALRMYYDFYHSQYFPVHNLHQHQDYNPAWQRIEDSLRLKHTLDNDKALASYNYDYLIENFLMRDHERLVYIESQFHPVRFYRQWYQTTEYKGKETFDKELKQLLFERIINKNFSNKSTEYLYTCLMRRLIRMSNFKNIDVIYAHYKEKYPAGKYLAVFKPAIDKYKEKKKGEINSKMVFVANNGTQINTLQDLIKLQKGKTVFVDMWGTWCGPCRQELEKYGPLIRAHFKNKKVTFLYVANNDLRNRDEWKCLIAFYQIEGTHVLANEKLTKDIMTKIKRTGFPSYFIIDKKGGYRLAKTPDESHTQDMINEIESYL
jgi:thiol-disulfide isomerase/thioredoxin